jgi:hypothetical protein
MECALDLGSLAMATALRALVNKPEVAKLRAALGPERYARVLASPLAQNPSPPALPAGDLDLIERLIRCGAVEFAAFADSLHPAWGESVRLTYERAWWLDVLPASLTPAMAESCLRLRAQPSGGAPPRSPRSPPRLQA